MLISSGMTEKTIKNSVLSYIPALLAGAICVSPVASLAQNTSGVSGPVVDGDEKSVEYRLGLTPDGAGDSYAHRLHYEQALSAAVKTRAVLMVHDRAGENASFSSARAELTWQVTPDDRFWQSGLRTEIQYRDGGPVVLGARWLNEWDLNDSWTTRFNLIGQAETGNGAADGLFLETRASLSRTIGARKVGLELFNDFGSTADMPDFDGQEHQAGPFLETSLGDTLQLKTGILFGLSDAADDTTFKLSLGRDL